MVIAAAVVNVVYELGVSGHGILRRNLVERSAVVEQIVGELVVGTQVAPLRVYTIMQ